MAIIKKYFSEVVGIEQPFSDIFVVTFKSLEKPYKYLPGQFLHLALDKYDPSAPWPESRCFSMQTNEEDEILKITYSVKGTFTKRMAYELKVGKQVCLKLPFGEIFTKSHSKERAVFIAGGTGVTPFLSLLTCHHFSEYIKPRLYLGVRNKSYFIYEKEIQKARGLNSSFYCKILFQDTDGMLDIQTIYNDCGNDSTYFISGPPVMIRNFKIFLAGKGVNPELIRTDDWE